MWFSDPSWTGVVFARPPSAAVVAAPPGGALHLGVQPVEVGVVAAEVVVIGVVGRTVDLPGADAAGQPRPGRRLGRRPVQLLLRRPAPQPELIPDGARPENHPEAREQRPLERVRPAQAVTADGTVELPVPQPEHPPERDDDEGEPPQPARVEQKNPGTTGGRRALAVGGRGVRGFRAVRRGRPGRVRWRGTGGFHVYERIALTEGRSSHHHRYAMVVLWGVGG